MADTSERYRDLVRKAVSRYLYDTVGVVRPNIRMLSEYTAGTELLENQFAFKAEISNGTDLVAIVDPQEQTVTVTDVNAGNESTRSYRFVNILGLLLIP